MYTVRLTKRAEKGYLKLTDDYRKKVNQLLLFLESNAYPAKFYDMLKLGEDTYRIRLGRTRIQYNIFNEDKVILVYKIELRDDSTYKK